MPDKKGSMRVLDIDLVKNLHDQAEKAEQRQVAVAAAVRAQGDPATATVLDIMAQAHNHYKVELREIVRAAK